MVNLEDIDDIRNKIKELIINSDLSEFLKYINENNIYLDKLNNKNFDILQFSIINGASYGIIEYIVNQYKTSSVSLLKTTLFSNLYLSIIKKNYRVADLLLDKNVDINYGNGIIIDEMNRSGLKYILNHGYDKKNIDLNFCYGLIENFNQDQLEIIMKYFNFGVNAVLDFLYIYKHKVPKSDEELKNKISSEKQNVPISASMYKKALELNNYEAIRILLENDDDHNNRIVDGKKLITFDIVNQSIKLRNARLLNAFLDYITYNYRSSIKKKNQDQLEKLNKYQNIDLKKLFMHSSLNISSSVIKKLCVTSPKQFDERYLNCFVNLAIFSNNIEFIKQLNNNFKIKLNLGITDFRDESIFDYLFKYQNSSKIFEYLYENPAFSDLESYRNELLSKAIFMKNYKIIYYLFSKNININEINGYGDYPIYEAIYFSDLKSVQLLVNYAKMRGIKFTQKLTPPLIYSYKLSRSGSLLQRDIFLYLVETGLFRINQTDEYGRKLLYYTINHGDVTMTKYLVQLGADVFSVDEENNSSLEIAIRTSNKKNILFLLNARKKLVNRVNNQGETPIFSIIKKKMNETCKIRIIKHFIKKGCNLNYINYYGVNPLFYADEASVIDLLLDYDAYYC